MDYVAFYIAMGGGFLFLFCLSACALRAKCCSKKSNESYDDTCENDRDANYVPLDTLSPDYSIGRGSDYYFARV